MPDYVTKGIADSGATVSLCCTTQACKNRRERTMLKRQKGFQKMIDGMNSEPTKCMINASSFTMGGPLSGAFLGTHPSRVCASCGCTDPCEPKLLMCSRCKCSYFCDKMCMKKVWKVHKKTCAEPAPGCRWGEGKYCCSGNSTEELL